MLLELEDVSHTPPGWSNPVLDRVSLRLEPQQILVVAGASGAGKTTMLRCVNALTEAGSGRVLLRGVDTRMLPMPELRRRVAFIAQTPHMFDGTVADNLATAAAYVRRPATRQSMLDALEAASLKAAMLERGATQLSLGQQQRVAFARVMMGAPEVLLCDEPTASLDARAQTRLEQAVISMRDRGIGIVFVTHDVDQAARIADRVVVIADGRLREGGRS